MKIFKKDKKDNSIFKFLSPEAPLSYNEVQYNIEEITNTKDPRYNQKLYFLYDKQSNRFVYIYESNVYIFNSKGSLETYTKVELLERVKLAAVEYNCNFLLLLTRSNQGIICSLLNNIYENYNIFDKGDFIGGFFIKRNPEKDNRYCKLCMISNKNFIISKIYLEQNERGEIKFKRKNFYTSKEMHIYNYFYNSDSNIVIFRTEASNFGVINLKSKACYEHLITLNNLNKKSIIQNSIFMVRNIYHTLHFIHMNSSDVEFYEIKDLKNINQPKIIKLDFGVNFQNVKTQFTNNLIFIYTEKNIHIYDLKCKSNNQIMTINFDKNKDYLNFYKNIKIYGDYIAIGRQFYKTNFLVDIFVNNRFKDSEIEVFRILIRRENCRNTTKRVLINTLLNCEIDLLFRLITILIKKSIKSSKNIINDKKNPFQVLSYGKNYFYLNNDEIFALFSRKVEGINPMRIIQLMGILYKIYIDRNITIDNDIFVSTMFYQLNQVKDFAFMESSFKNNIMPINYKLGMYLVDKAIHNKNDILDWNKVFNIGIENLMEKEEGIEDAVNDLFENKDYYECFDLINDYLYQKNVYGNKLGTIGYLKNFMSGQLQKVMNKEGNEDEDNNEDEEEKNDVEAENEENKK